MDENYENDATHNSEINVTIAFIQSLPGIMKRLITTTIFILIVSALTAQTIDKTIFVGNVISDTTTIRSNVYRTALPSIFKSKNKIEIRFITSPSFENTNKYTNYKILTFNKKWSAKYYYYKPDTNNLFSKDISAKYNYCIFRNQLTPC